MKKLIYIFLLFAAFACNNETVEKDNDNPLVYIPRYGFSLNEIWALDGGTDNHYLNVYCSGLFSGASNEIEVGYQVDPSLVTAYNDDITQQYSGQVKELPSDCYRVTGTSAKILKGETAAKIPIEFDIAKIKALEHKADEYYVVPIRLTSTSKYNLHDDENYTNALYAINLKEPLFYFYNNRNGQATQDCKVIYGSEQVMRYMVVGTGIPEGSYTVDVEYTPDLLDKYESGTVLPESAFEIINSSVVFENEHSTPNLEVKFKADGISYNKTYYLPLTITSTSAYQADESRSTLVVKVQLKNEYEKTYSSSFSIFSTRWTRTATYSASKSITSYDNDIVEMLMIKTGSTIAGATSQTGTSSTFANKYMRIKIIPTDDPTHYDIELIKVEDSGSKNSPATLELTPGQDSYYNYNKEEFVLNYRFQDSKGFWMEVTEVASAG